MFDHKISHTAAVTIMLILPTCLIVFHICNLFGLIPQNIVWTGRISSRTSLVVMGSLSIVLNLLLVFCALIGGEYITNQKYQNIGRVLIPFMFWWLVVNTIANLFSVSRLELIVFTPMLILLTISCYVIWRSNERKSV